MIAVFSLKSVCRLTASTIDRPFVLMPLLALVWVSNAMVVPCSASPPTKQVYSYTDVLHELTDLDRLTRLQTDCRGGLFSSWDRNATRRWGANGDAGQYLRVEPSGEAVMVELDGPGVIYRVWSANPMGRIRVYLDGAETPSYEWGFPELFDGQLFPFIKPLVYRRDRVQSASDCYLPIPFARHIKICADQAHGQYYHFNYVLFPQDRPVASFRLPLTGEEQAALQEVADAWSHPGRDPKPKLPGQVTISQTVTVEPGGSIDLCALQATGVIRSIRMRVASEQRYAWRKLVLRGVWDDAPWPQVLTPLGPLFGFDWETAEYGSLPAGCIDGQAYQFFPMPFRKSARLALQNFLEKPATVAFEIQWAPLSELPADAAYFYARWRHEPDALTFDYPILETAGRGHFVGVAMPIDHPLPGWWGEGDEKVWVDDDDFPPYFGTGSEDYFGDAWGIRYLSAPSFGAASMEGHRTCNYRWHFTDLIPFDKRIRMTMENYGPNGSGPRGQYDYSSTAFWYQAELTPPFEQLRGVKLTGGTDPNAEPTQAEYDATVFSDLDADNLRTYGLGITFAQQAEALLAESIDAGDGRVVTDALRPYEFDRERAVDFGPVHAGQQLGTFQVQVDADTVYDAHLYTAQESGLADLSLEVGGKRLPIAAHNQPHVIQLGGLYLTRGEQTVSLVAATDGRAIFDCLQLEPAARFPQAIECEELAVVQVSREAGRPQPSDPISGVSAGRVLNLEATQSGQGMVLDLAPRPELPYVLGVRPMVGPDAAVIQAFVADRPIGPRFDLYAPQRQLGPSVLPVGPVPGNTKEVEIRAVGKNERSEGYRIQLDYMRWEPEILGPETSEGVWAQVLATRGCRYEPQNLGPSYSSGHQFWVQPSSPRAWVDLAIEIPATGSHEFSVKYTKSWDYAVIQAFLDGEALGDAIDTYSATVVPGETISLGRRELTAGRHVLRFQAVGNNPQSKGYLMGIDHVNVK